MCHYSYVLCVYLCVHLAQARPSQPLHFRVYCYVIFVTVRFCFTPNYFVCCCFFSLRDRFSEAFVLDGEINVLSIQSHVIVPFVYKQNIVSYHKCACIVSTHKHTYICAYKLTQKAKWIHSIVCHNMYD